MVKLIPQQVSANWGIRISSSSAAAEASSGAQHSNAVHPDDLRTDASCDPQHNGETIGDDHHAVGSKRQRRHVLNSTDSDADLRPAQRAVGQDRLGGQCCIQRARGVSFNDACVEVTRLTQNQKDHADGDTSPAVSPVEEMTNRLFTIADFSNLEENSAACAPRCAFRPRPHRWHELSQEIGHVLERATQQREQMYSDCPRYDDYLHTVQHGALDANHRRKVFEWNLGVCLPIYHRDPYSPHSPACVLIRYLNIVSRRRWPTRTCDSQITRCTCRSTFSTASYLAWNVVSETCNSSRLRVCG
jgi:hypothetical protein